MSLHAQQPFLFYAAQPGTYPKITDLFKGIANNQSDTVVNVNIKYSLWFNGAVAEADSLTGIRVQPGMNNLVTDSFIAQYLQQGGSDAYLLPGNYTLDLLFTENENKTSTQQTFTVPGYVMRLRQDSSGVVAVEMEPPSLQAQVYVCRLNMARRKRDEVLTCFLSPGFLLKENRFPRDSTQSYKYRVEVYAGGNLVGKTQLTDWDELGGSAIIKEEEQPAKRNGIKDVVKAGASVGMEYGYTNAKYANQLSSTQYARLYLKPTVSVFGVPFTFNSMITTETNSHYPLNYFQFGFDANKFASDFAHNAIKDQLAVEQRMELNAIGLDKVNKNLAKYRRELPAPEAINTDTIGREKPHRKALFEGRKKKKAQDMNREIEELQIKKRALEYDQYKDSVYLAIRKRDISDNDTIQRFLKKQPYKNLTKTLLAVKSLQIGFCTPHYSPITLSQVPLKGFHTELKFRHWFVSGTVGNRITIQPGLGLRNNLVPEFKNRTYATRLGIIDVKNRTSVYVGYFYFRNDPDRFNPATSENTILSAGFESRIISRLLLTGEVAKSFFQASNGPGMQQETYGVVQSFGKDYKNVSFNLGATVAVSKNTELSAVLKKTGTGYYTLGIPFLRNDYIEYSASWKQFYWYKQLETEFSYMENRDNLSALKLQTTILRGYGATLKTHFRSLPNLLVMYKPFNSSFSFEQNILSQPGAEPALITQQFYLLHATVFYNTSVKTIKLNTSVGYNRSNNRNSAEQVYTLETITGSLLFTGTNGGRLNYLASVYRSTINLNNSVAHDLSYSASVLKNKLRTTIGGVSQFVNDGKQRNGLYSQSTVYIKNMSLSVRLSSMYLRGNWYVGNNTFENAVNVYLEYRL